MPIGLDTFALVFQFDREIADVWGLEVVQELRRRRQQHEPWPGMGDVNETAEPYREFPGQFVR